MCVFFQVQGLWAVLFAIPVLMAARNPAVPGWADVAGVLIRAAAVLGERTADRRLARFRADPANRGPWRYPRHPDCFFEWVHWWACVAFGLAGAYRWITLMGPVVMLFFLLRITGVPPTEARALSSRGDACRAYQRRTNRFCPGPRRVAPLGETRS